MPEARCEQAGREAVQAYLGMRAHEISDVIITPTSRDCQKYERYRMKVKTHR